MTTKTTTRQRIRRALILISFLLFPITLNYFSPYLIIDGASQGVVNGSFVVFGLLFLSSLVLGRGWCGWVCPAGGLGEACFMIQDRPARTGRADWVKWFIWVPWIILIVVTAVMAGGYRQVNLLLKTETGITMNGETQGYIIYFFIVGLFFALSLVAGRRAVCHYVCWMAPFMIIGRWLRNRVRWPSLALRVEKDKCTSCKLCTRNCPMSLDVMGMVLAGKPEHPECILCGMCVDTCPKNVIHYTFRGGAD
jgi:ferredoxin-type protein NapH